MLALFNAVDDATRQLVASLRTAGLEFSPVVIWYDGYLPDGAVCPFTTYTGIEPVGEPLFFNQVPVPQWCEIRQGDEVFAEVLRDTMTVGRIHYDADSFRQVQCVDWLAPDQMLSHTDRYDRYGNHYATTYYHDGAAYQTVYHGPRECQVEVAHRSRAVTVRTPQTLLTFATVTDFVSHFLDSHGIADDHTLVNSLSYPLFVMRGRATRPNTTLFWQEPMPGDIPGNMATELDQPTALERIVFCDEHLRTKVAAAHRHTTVDLAYLSHLGQFADTHGDLARTFTLTSTDEIPWLVDLLDALPDVTFCVAALTLMSDKLHDLARTHPNLTLVPTITHAQIRDELERASVYLDIDAGTHVRDVVKAAYHLNLLVLASAAHAKSPDHSRTFSTSQDLASLLSAVTTSEQARTTALDDLHTQHGPQSTPADYHQVFADGGDNGDGSYVLPGQSAIAL
ncbi:MAG: hypothetical protein FWE61_04615 [Micrococcales bacterium]|nr:hypothetical protein [Micrococcales bacterium]